MTNNPKSPLELMYQLNREKRQEKQRAREQVQQKIAEDNARINSRVDALRQSNMQNSKNLSTVGGAIAHGVMSGVSEALTENQLKYQQYKAYMDEMTDAINDVERELQQTQTTQSWLKQNYSGLGSIVSYFPQLGSVRAARALTPYIDDLGRAIGEHADITDINTETGMVTIMTDKGNLEQMNFYDLFPDIKSSLLMHQSVQQAGGLYSNEQLMRQAQMEYEDEQRRLNRRENRDDMREKRENEKWGFQKRALEAERQQQEQQQRMQSYEENVTDDNGNPIIPTENEKTLYRIHLDTAKKRIPEIRNQQSETKTKLQTINGIAESLHAMKELRNRIDADPELKNSWLVLGQNGFPKNVRELVTSLPKVAKLGVSQKVIDFIQEVADVEVKYTAELQSEVGRALMGGVGIRNKFEFLTAKSAMPSLFGTQANFNQKMNAIYSFLNGKAMSLNTTDESLNAELKSYETSEKEYAKYLRKKKASNNF